MNIPRLNGIVGVLEEGWNVFVSFAPADPANAQLVATDGYDGVVFEMEHGAYDARALRDCLQYLLNRRQIVESGSLAPAVTPMVRIPPNGCEMNQWVAKQVLDSGVYGIVWPHVSTVEEARSAVAACRYARPAGAPRYEPAGQRGDAPAYAARYWGLSQQEYYERADLWPLDPKGEILVAIMCEDVVGLRNLPKILKEVPGIGAVIVGEGDLSQNLGFPRQYSHPVVAGAIAEILAICREANVACGHPHVEKENLEEVVKQGFRWLMPRPARSNAVLATGLKLSGRR
ncbi:MAG: aldolase [Burkholderiales bacterium]|nr:aldolase [Burkholderiales bacterium]